MFYIKESEGASFAKFSGDNNAIHINKIAGHNSIHGHNIAHGVLVILKFMKRIDLALIIDPFNDHESKINLN